MLCERDLPAISGECVSVKKVIHIDTISSWDRYFLFIINFFLLDVYVAGRKKLQ